MKIRAQKNNLSGSIQVPGSKSHTIRALLLASLSDGECHIKNPLQSADCLSTGHALPLLGASVDFAGDDNSVQNTWTVRGGGKNIHLPEDVVNVGNSGSLLYFLSPIASTFEGWSIFTGDESIRSRPVFHVVDALKQLGAEAYISQPGKKVCPLLVKGPVKSGKVLTTGEISSQYISGLMMAALRIPGGIEIELTNPKETPYLSMTQKWLEMVGAQVKISSDFKHIKVQGPVEIKAFDTTVPSDWEGVAFPLIAALLSDSEVKIIDVDSSGTQGDDAIVDVLKSIGADIDWNKNDSTITVRGGKKSKDKIGRLSTDLLKNKEFHVNLSPFPDAICALAVIACFTDGKTVLEDLSVCRKKETDRVKVMTSLLTSLGADVEEGSDYMIINGHSPRTLDGSANPDFTLHGGQIPSYKDHRVAMSFACMALGLPLGEEIIIEDAECAKVSFPAFYEKMNDLGANFLESL